MDISKSYIIILVVLLLQSRIYSHDINSNKISLIMREKNHVSLIMNLNLLKVMNQILSPQTKYGDFIITFSNMDSKNFHREYEKTKTKIISGIIITSREQGRLSFRDWKWPDLKVVQNQFQVYVMELVTGSHDHNKEPIVEITAEIIDKSDKTKIQIQVLKEIHPILLISYKPTTIWIEESKNIDINF